MKRLLIYLALIVSIAAIVSALITWIVNLKIEGGISSPLSTWAAIWQAISAVAAILVMLFADSLKSAIDKASPDINVSREAPLTCIVSKQDPKESDDSSSVVEICAEILNPSATTARNCQLVCGHILASTKDSEYSVQHEFCQMPFEYIHNKATEADLPQDLRRYVKLAVIAPQNYGHESINIQSTKNKKSDKKPKQNTFDSTVGRGTLRIAITNRVTAETSIEIDPRLKYVLIPVLIVAIGCETKRKVIKIHWEGNAPTETGNSSLYNIEVLEPSEVVKLLQSSVDQKIVGV